MSTLTVLDNMSWFNGAWFLLCVVLGAIGVIHLITKE